MGKLTLIKTVIIVVLLLCLVGLLSVFRERVFVREDMAYGFVWAQRGLKREDVREGIVLAAGYIMDCQLGDGRFTYRVHVDAYEHARLGRSYNILRHAGTIYSLGHYYDITRDERAVGTMKKAVDWIVGETVEGVPGEDESLLAIWSSKKVYSSDTKLAKAGGAGLGMVGIISLENIVPGYTDIDVLRKLANFIIFLQKDNGGLYARYYPHTGYDPDYEVLYYPGECALGLTMLYEIDPNPKWIDAAIKILEFLANSRIGKRNVEADHWALIATRKIFEMKTDPNFRSEKLLLDHAMQISRSIMASQNTDKINFPYYAGGFTRSGKTTAAATRLEGLIAARPIITDPSFVARLDKTIDFAMDFLLDSELTEGPYKGGFPQMNLKGNMSSILLTDKDVKNGGLIQIDQVQHSLSAMSGYYHLVQSRKKTPLE